MKRKIENKIKIFYWSPYLGKVATIRSVLNSMLSICEEQKYETKLIDCYGEWDFIKKKKLFSKIQIKKIQNFIKFKTKSYGFIISRIKYFATYIITYFNLKKELNKEKPDFLIIHLLTYIPLLLFLFNNFQTKLILRISGKPKLSFFRYILWKFASKKVHLVFCPTNETQTELFNLKIFNNNQIKYLPDPVIDINEIKKLKYKKVKKTFSKNDYFLTIGRFTKQKNYELILKTISEFNLKENFLFIGEGELKNNIKKKIKKLNLEKRVKMLDYQKNIFDYINNSKAVVVSSLWEDPGFVMIEAAHSKKIIICSNCPSGPKEFIQNDKSGFLFKSNDPKSLRNAIIRFQNSTSKNIKYKIFNAKKNSKIYTIQNHKKILKSYLR